MHNFGIHGLDGSKLRVWSDNNTQHTDKYENKNEEANKYVNERKHKSIGTTLCAICAGKNLRITNKMMMNQCFTTANLFYADSLTFG